MPIYRFAVSLMGEQEFPSEQICRAVLEQQVNTSLVIGHSIHTGGAVHIMIEELTPEKLAEEERNKRKLGLHLKA